jgi:hypothetical protein
MGELAALKRFLRRARPAAGEEHKDGEEGDKPRSAARNSLWFNHRLAKEGPANQAGHESKPCR